MKPIAYRGTILQPDDKSSEGFTPVDDAVVVVGTDGRIEYAREVRAIMAVSHQRMLPQGLRAVDGQIFFEGQSLAPTSDVVLPHTMSSHDHAFQPPGVPGELIKQVGAESVGWLPTTLRIGEAVAKNDPKRAEAMAKERLRQFADAGVGSMVVYSTSSVEATQAVLRAASEVGVRAQVGYVAMDQNINGITPGLQTSRKEAVTSTRWLLEQYANGAPYQRMAVIDRFPIAVSSETRKALAELAREFGVTFETHADESIGERDYHRSLYGGRSIMDVLFDDGVFEPGSRVGLAHAIHTSPTNMDRIGKAITKGCEVYIRACPNSNAILGSHRKADGTYVPFPLKAWLERGVTMTLGTDQGGGRGTNIFSEMVWERGRHAADDQPSPLQLLRYGTVNGLGALGIEKTHSMIIEGNPANFVVVRMAGADGFYSLTDHHGDIDQTAARVIEGGQYEKNVLANYVGGRNVKKPYRL